MLGSRLSVSFLIIVTVIWSLPESMVTVDVDPKGYIAFCPCMGRFGNQADQFLGALRFAKALDRTIILPPWVEYHRTKLKSVQVPFDKYFKVSKIREFHRAVTMALFMKELAPTVWPPGERVAFCYGVRSGKIDNSCNAKEGNPFESFWDTYNINFDRSVFYAPLTFETGNTAIDQWKKRFPPEKYPVLAMTGTPGSFPVVEFDVPLQKYMDWSAEYDKMAADFIKKQLSEGPFVGIHLRNGIDFKRACEHIKEGTKLFASPQCTGYRGQHGQPTYETCFPSDKTVVKQVKAAVKKFKATAVYVATDDRDLIDVMKKSMKKVKFVRQPSPSSPHLDLAILGRADGFIGNCISSFSAFAVRERKSKGLPFAFWAFESKSAKDEL